MLWTPSHSTWQCGVSPGPKPGPWGGLSCSECSCQQGEKPRPPAHRLPGQKGELHHLVWPQTGARWWLGNKKNIAWGLNLCTEKWHFFMTLSALTNRLSSKKWGVLCMAPLHWDLCTVSSSFNASKYKSLSVYMTIDLVFHCFSCFLEWGPLAEMDFFPIGKSLH